MVIFESHQRQRFEIRSGLLPSIVWWTLQSQCTVTFFTIIFQTRLCCRLRVEISRAYL